MSRFASSRLGYCTIGVMIIGGALTTDASAVRQTEESDGDAQPASETADPMTGDDLQAEPEPLSVAGGGETTCTGASLPTCSPTTTGPSCAFPCDAGSACSFRYYCHGDDRIAGMAVVRSRLFTLSPSATPTAAAAALETWATQREVDLGFPNGLTTTLLQFAPADNAKVTQGALNLYRIRQFYRASTSLPSLPVVGDGSLLTLEASPVGVVALKGTIVDPRRVYAFSASQATSAKAIASIKQHTSTRLGIPVAQISVNTPVRVAVPRVEQIGWYGVAYRGGNQLARVTVSANPVPVTLPLLIFDTGVVEGLADTVPIEVKTQDPTSDPFLEPFMELDVDELADGTPLLGSVDDFSLDTQLADSSVVLVDVQGGTEDNLLTGNLSRYTSATDTFLAGQPTDYFYAQRMFYLLRSAYAIMNRVAVGKWDSVIQKYAPMLTSGYAPGAFAPRMIALFHHQGLLAAAAHEAYGIQSAADLMTFSAQFPEIIQRPAPTATPELVGTMQLPDESVGVDILFHELGHGFDVFLGPGNAREYAPDCQLGSPGCDEVCDEDTTDEAWPLDETVAQMISLWMVRRTFPELPHGQCDLLDQYSSGGTENLQLVHSPECLDPGDQLNIWLRDDDPACTDDTLCDKPDRQAAPDFGYPNNCRTTDGYNTFSILQAWWNTLNGKYCQPTTPFDCIDYAPQWPPGCGGGGGAPACVTADEAAGLALIYALRTNALSYVEFFDAMSRFVACNYGNDAYLVFNTALCDHGIRPCDAPLPLVCETCGNGIREGGENCDGQDLTVDEVGIVPQCTDFGYAGGDLACDAMCDLDFSACELPPADTSAGGEASSGAETGGSASAGEGTGGSSADGGQVGEDGCACNSGPGDGQRAALLALALLGLRRRRVAAAALAMGASGCRPSGGGSDTAETTSMGASSDSSSSSSSGSVGVDGWPERWHGQYYEATFVDLNYEEVEIELGVELEWYQAGSYFYNVRVEAGGVQLDYFNSTGSQTGSSLMSPVVNPDHLLILPEEGEEYIDWAPSSRIRAEIYPGLDCSELKLEMSFDATNEPLVTTLRRGRICLVVPCDPDDGIQCKVTVDYCTDDPAPTTCDPV